MSNKKTHSSNSSLPRWHRFARIFGFVLLAAMTVYGIREFALGDSETVTGYWVDKLPWLPVIVFFFAIDLVLEGVAWVWVYERFGMRARDPLGFGVYLSGNAGLLMPAQLGRLIRPDTMVRLQRGTVAACLKAEGSVFVLDALSVVALLTGAIVWLIHPLLAPLAALSLIAICLFLGNTVANRLAGTRLDLPRGFWWSWQSWVIVFVEMAGWFIHGVAFYVLVADLPGHLTLWDAVFYAPGSAVLGVGSGMPGGVGTTEGLLGTALRINQVPAAHLALVVGAFRVITFWLRIPIGWSALAVVRRRAAKVEAQRRETGPRPAAGGDPLDPAPLALHAAGADDYGDGSQRS
jgi:uncharacterized membrane protein YbhN (UPF0104 family)